MMIWICIQGTGEQENPMGPCSAEEVNGANYMPRYKEGYSQEMMSKLTDDEFEIL